MRHHQLRLSRHRAGLGNVPSETEITAIRVGSCLVLRGSFPVRIVVVAGDEGAVGGEDFADAAQVVPCVKESVPGRAVFPLFAFVEVAAVEVGGGGAAGVAAEQADAAT